MSRAAAVFLAGIGCAAIARADAGATSLEAEQPPRVQTIAVNPGDPVAPAAQARFAGQRPTSEFILHCKADGSFDRLEELQTIAGAEEHLRKLVSTFCHRIAASAPYREHETIELSFRPAESATAPPPRRYKNVPPSQFHGQKIRGDLPHLPDIVKLRRMGEQLGGMYKVCVGPDGNVDSVSSLQPIPDANDAIVATLKGWKLKPQAQGICTLLRFEFAISEGRRFR
ncbi:MAG TPA: hypothetical protein VF945_07525 [Polyangia bacterium]